MPSFNDRRIVASALDAGVHVLENELGKTREAMLDILAEALQREAETIKFWLRGAKIPASIDDGTFYSLIWIIVSSTRLGDGWLRFVLSETSEPIRPEIPVYAVREYLRTLLRKATLGADKHPIPEDRISALIDEIYPMETGANNGSSIFAPSTKSLQPNRYSYQLSSLRRWGVKPLLILIPLLIAIAVLYPLPPRGCTGNASRIIAGPEATVVFSRNILLRNFYEYPFYIYFKDELVQPQYLNLSANQTLFDGWRFRVTSDFQTLHSDWNQAELWRVDGFCNQRLLETLIP